MEVYFYTGLTYYITDQLSTYRLFIIKNQKLNVLIFIFIDKISKQNKKCLL